MDKRIMEILKARARRYAPPPEEKKEDTSIGTFVGCRIGDLQLALPSDVLVECAPLLHWTPFSGRKHLLGLTHLRGDVMALLDLLEAITGKRSGKCSGMAVIQAPAGRFAVPIAEVLGLRSVEMGELLPSEQLPVDSPLVFAATRDLWFLVNDQALVELAGSGQSSNKEAGTA